MEKQIKKGKVLGAGAGLRVTLTHVNKKITRKLVIEFCNQLRLVRSLLLKSNFRFLRFCRSTIFQYKKLLDYGNGKL